MFSQENKDEVIGLICQHDQQTIRFTNIIQFEGNIQLFIDKLQIEIKQTIQKLIETALKGFHRHNEFIQFNSILFFLLLFRNQ